MKLRFIPDIKAARNIQAIGKMQKVRSAQVKFTENIKVKTTSGIIGLDFTVKKDGNELPKLRQMIMEIQPRDKPGETLFHSVDPFYRNAQEMAFQTTVKNETEATLMIENLFPYLRHKYGEEVSAYFHPREVRRAEGVTVDKNGNICTEFDEYIDIILEADPEYVFEGVPTHNFTSSEGSNLQQPNPQNLQVTNNDDLTISTLGPLESSPGRAGVVNFTVPTQPTIGGGGRQQDRLISDDLTIATMATVQTLQEKYTQMQQVMAKILSRLPDPENDKRQTSTNQNTTDSGNAGAGPE